MSMTEKNIAKQLEWRHQALFYALGPITTDIAPGYAPHHQWHLRNEGEKLMKIVRS
jgi:thiamine biosynthesis protein ThiC